MKKIIFSTLIVAGLASCKSEPKYPLEGKWEIVKAEGNMSEINIGTFYEFKEKTKLILSNSAIENEGTTKITDNTFTFHSNGTDESMIFSYGYHFKNDTLVVEVENSDQKFYLLRK